MIIKALHRASFRNVLSYVLRQGRHAAKGEKTILAQAGIYNQCTAAAQMKYDAALAPERTRPVIHLIANAEKRLSNEQYRELGCRMLAVAGLTDRRFMLVSHDDDDHIHLVTTEVDSEGKPPPRLLWSTALERVVTAEEAARQPQGDVTSRAWDSHLAMRLAALAREVEDEWGLRRLGQAPKKAEQDLAGENAPFAPKIDRWQEERLRESGKVPLQDRYGDFVRAALQKPSWDERMAGLASESLSIRVHYRGAEPRGLILHSLTEPGDYVKISAFGLGGMKKLDASADMPFLAWQPGPPSRKVDLSRPTRGSFDRDMKRMQGSYKAHLADREALALVRDVAYDRRRATQRDIKAALVKFSDEVEGRTSPRELRRACAILRRGMKDAADQRLRAALDLAGPIGPRMTFADYVKNRAGAGNATALRVYHQSVGGVSEQDKRRQDCRLFGLKRDIENLKERRAKLDDQIVVAARNLTGVRRDAGWQFAGMNASAVAGFKAAIAAFRARRERQVIDWREIVAVSRRRWRAAAAQDAARRERALARANADRQEQERALRAREAEMRAAQARADELRHLLRPQAVGVWLAGRIAKDPLEQTYLVCWSNAIEKIPPEASIVGPAGHAAELAAIASLLQEDRSDDAVARVVQAHSPVLARSPDIVATDYIDALLKDTTVVAERRLRDARRETEATRRSLIYSSPQTFEEKMFVTLWLQILAELPINPERDAKERNTLVDYEVAAEMQRKVEIALVMAALRDFSPNTIDMEKSEQDSYVAARRTELETVTGALRSRAVGREDERPAVTVATRADPRHIATTDIGFE